MKMKKLLINNLKMIKYINQFCPRQIPIIIFMAVLRSAQSIMSVLFLKYTIDSIGYNNLQYLMTIIGGFLLLNLLLAVIIILIEQKIIPVNSQIISGKIQLLLFEKAASIDLDCYENTSYYNKLVIAREQAEKRMIGVMNSLSTIISSLFSIGAFITLITSIEPLIILFSFLNVALSFVFNTLAIKIQHKFYNKRMPIERKMDYVKRVSSLSEFAKELRIYNKFPELLKNRFNEGQKELILLINKYSKKYIKVISLQNIIGQTLNAGIIVYLAHRVLTKAISVGDFIALANGTQQLTSQINILIKAVPEIYEHGIYIESFLEFMDYQPKIKNGDKYIKVHDNTNIEFKDVYFKYSNTTSEVLKNINFTIKSGEKIALVGRNGSGKSTIVKLLTRLYDPTSGSIYIQGSPYQEYNVSSLRNYFGTLFQDFQIFAVSVAENILMCEIDEKINDEKRVKEALNFVELEQKVDNLKFGVYTELTREFDNNGAIFSGGEYQKVAIARVFNKNSKVIILDEPSSALDPISEKELFDKMNELASDKAVIFVSHRLSNIVNVDKILFLENGEIKECGTHSELMCINGLYAEMYRIQADKYMQEIT